MTKSCPNSGETFFLRLCGYDDGVSRHLQAKGLCFVDPDVETEPHQMGRSSESHLSSTEFHNFIGSPLANRCLQNLVTGIVDYAGLFPPAALDMPTVVNNYKEYLNSPHCSMLGRLIVPVARLDELEQHATPFFPRDETTPNWLISGLVPAYQSSSSQFQEAIRSIEAFNRKYSDASSGRATIDVIETKAPDLELVPALAAALPRSLSAFVELTLDDALEANIHALDQLNDAFGRSRFFAKIRTGGVQQELIPNASNVAKFISCCGRHLVPFKATAGLHHPLCGDYRLTYEPDAPLGKMFGFLNVFTAACFAFDGQFDPGFLESVLTDDGKQIRITDEKLEFGNQFVDVVRVRQIRRKFAFSFGSCSFEEPTHELDELFST